MMTAIMTGGGRAVLQRVVGKQYTGAPYDVTRAFVTASGATGEQTALLNFTKAAVDNDFYHDLIFFFPFVGNRKLNMLDPFDSNDAFRLTGDYQIDPKGIYIPSGGIVDTNLNIFDVCSKEWPYIGAGIYLQNAVDRIIDSGHQNFRYSFNGVASSKMYCNTIGDSNGITVMVARTGWLMAQRTGYYPREAAAVEVYRGNTLLGTDVQYDGGGVMPNGNIRLMPTQNTTLSLFAMHRPSRMNPTKTAAYNTAILNLINELGRAVA